MKVFYFQILMLFGFVIFSFYGCGRSKTLIELQETSPIITPRVKLLPPPTGEEAKAKIDAIQSQLIKQFGDIPQIRIFIQGKRKRLEKIPFTLDERIAYTEASLYLFPNPNTRQYLKQLKQWKAEGRKITFKYEKSK